MLLLSISKIYTFALDDLKIIINTIVETYRRTLYRSYAPLSIIFLKLHYCVISYNEHLMCTLLIRPHTALCRTTHARSDFTDHLFTHTQKQA